MNKPTNEQKREFWEWCKAPIKDIMAYNIISKENYATKLYPPVDLNNLFKYAVPVVRSKLGMLDTETLLRKWLNSFIWRTEDPTLNLFWVIGEVIKMEAKDVSTTPE